MREQEALELALHRALRAEVPPSVRAIVATELSTASIKLDVFSSRPAEIAELEEVVESELELQLGGVAPKLTCRFLPSGVFSMTPSVRLIIYDNPWATG